MLWLAHRRSDVLYFKGGPGGSGRGNDKTMKKANVPQSKKRQFLQYSQSWLRLIPRNTYSGAMLITLLIAAWFLSGEIIIGGHKANPPSRHPTHTAKLTVPTSTPLPAFTVQTMISTARQRDAMLQLRGHTKAEAQVQVRAQTAGIVRHIHNGKGQFVKAGTLLCALEKGVRPARLDQARAQQAEARQKYLATRRLYAKGHASKTKLLAAKARYQTAVAETERARLDLDYTQITAPIDGIIEEQPARKGAYLPVGGTCATMVRLNPLLVVAEVSENDIAKLKTGQRATAKLVTGEAVSGRIRYIAAMANPQTRTFKIEVEIRNPANRLRSGITTTLKIPLARTRGHLLPPSVLVLDANGRMGVRTVDHGNIVHFKPVKILANDKNGIWVTGLNPTERIIRIGQNYVREGQKVLVRPAVPSPRNPAIASPRTYRSIGQQRSIDGGRIQ